MMVTRQTVHWLREVLTMTVVGVGLVALQWLRVIAPLRSSIQTISQPLLVGAGKMTFLASIPGQRLTNQFATATRVEQLEQALNTALAKQSELEQVEQENQQLRQTLGAQARPQRTIIGSPIVSYGLPTISVGSQQGISAGNPVLAAGALVGLVDTVSEQQSTVSLLSQQQTTPVVVRTESGAEGLIVGDGKRVLLTEVAHDASLKPGDRILTVGQTHIPGNLLVGTVQELTSNQAAAVQTATVQQLTTFYEVSLIEVLP